MSSVGGMILAGKAEVLLQGKPVPLPLFESHISPAYYIIKDSFRTALSALCLVITDQLVLYSKVIPVCFVIVVQNTVTLYRRNVECLDTVSGGA
jgi:hypothetical protein